VIVAGRNFHVHRHVVERYQERVKPMLDGDALERDLQRVLASHATVTDRAPAWASGEDRVVEWIMLGDSIAFPVGTDNRVITCVTRSQPGDDNRERMRETARQRRERNARPGTRKKHGVVARSERRRARARKEAME
jgi:hypothetical protein